MKLVTMIAAMLAFSCVMKANQRAQGWCEQGGQAVVINPGISSTTQVQRSFPRCTVTVFVSGTQTPATLFSDNNSTPLANPFSADSVGHWFFYATSGHYDVQISGGGLAAPYTFGDIALITVFSGISLVGTDQQYNSISAAYAAAPSSGAWIVVGPGSFTEPATVNIAAAKPLHLSCTGSGSGTSGSGGNGPTVISFNSVGYLFQLAATDVTDSVTIDNCSFSIGSSATGWMIAGSTSQNTSFSLFRYGWAFTNTTVTGPGETVPGTIGMSLTELVGLTLNNFTIQSFEQTAIFDRPSVISSNHVRFAFYKFGPIFTQQAGTGSAATYLAQVILSNAEFLGPSTGTGNYTVTIDMPGVEFIQAIYEPEIAGVQAAIHITANGQFFRDFGGLLSTSPTGPSFVTYLVVMDNGFRNPVFDGTLYPGPQPAPSICMGTPGVCTGHQQSGAFSGAAVCMNCNPALYSVFRALGVADAVAVGPAPASYGPYLAFTGPVQVDLPAGGGGNSGSIRAQIQGNGVVGDTVHFQAPMPSSDAAAFAPGGFDVVTETAGVGSAQAGAAIRTGTNAATFQALYCDGFSNTGGCIVNGTLMFNKNLGRSGGCVGVHLYGGSGSPNTAQNGCIGDLFISMNGGAGTTLWVKESGNNTNTGWVGK